MPFVVIGHIGSDAGYWILGPNGWEHVGGWAVESITEVQQAMTVLSQMPQLKTPGLANAASKELLSFVEKSVGENVKGATGNVIVVMNQT
jgi:hypothetical protein